MANIYKPTDQIKHYISLVLDGTKTMHLFIPYARRINRR